MTFFDNSALQHILDDLDLDDDSAPPPTPESASAVAAAAKAKRDEAERKRIERAERKAEGRPDPRLVDTIIARALADALRAAGARAHIVRHRKLDGLTLSAKDVLALAMKGLQDRGCTEWAERNISLTPRRLERVRIERSPLSREVVTTAIESMVTVTMRSASGFVEAMCRMFAPEQEDRWADIVRMHLDLPWVGSHDELRSLLCGHDPVCCGAAASPLRLARSVPGKIKRDPDTGMPWFRQHERERTGRRW
ncbi:hypothetical protein [Methylobacterium sp. J-068]|uniref:hypothetical protein n=1 Tax=Methylobacterium sp. J-068 TaxID=2836649 RepID=UPI001FBB9290|nr:hypothetical protein [Methylobacterium sp. J-068]MCJ2036013.1 hypothetical protein [Methylobacterium sp. J-068]